MTDSDTQIIDDQEAKEPFMPMKVTTTDFGPGNEGNIGPEHLDDAVRSRISAETEKPKYRVRVDANESHCVDDRFKNKKAESKEALYPSQIAGSVPVTETASDFMVNPNPKPLSVTLRANARRAKADGIQAYVHGDDQHGEEGCAAHFKMRDVLRYNADNLDIVAPKTWDVAKLAGLDAHGVTQDDIVEDIARGGEAADNDELWDITAKEGVAIMLEEGAQYEEFEGPHDALKAMIEADPEYTYNGTDFAAEHPTDKGEDKVFVVTLGAYVAKQFERGRARGLSDYEIARKCAGDIAFQIGVPKKIGNENLEAGIVGLEA